MHSELPKNSRQCNFVGHPYCFSMRDAPKRAQNLVFCHLTLQTNHPHFLGVRGGVTFTSFPEMSSIDGNINLKIDLVLNLFPFTDNISRKRVILQLFQ